MGQVSIRKCWNNANIILRNSQIPVTNHYKITIPIAWARSANRSETAAKATASITAWRAAPATDLQIHINCNIRRRKLRTNHIISASLQMWRAALARALIRRIVSTAASIRAITSASKPWPSTSKWQNRRSTWHLFENMIHHVFHKTILSKSNLNSVEYPIQRCHLVKEARIKVPHLAANPASEMTTNSKWRPIEGSQSFPWTKS